MAGLISRLIMTTVVLTMACDLVVVMGMLKSGAVVVVVVVLMA